MVWQWAFFIFHLVSLYFASKTVTYISLRLLRHWIYYCPLGKWICAKKVCSYANITVNNLVLSLKKHIWQNYWNAIQIFQMSCTSCCQLAESLLLPGVLLIGGNDTVAQQVMLSSHSSMLPGSNNWHPRWTFQISKVVASKSSNLTSSTCPGLYSFI